MKCREIDEAFAIFDLCDDCYMGENSKLKLIPEPVPDDKLQKAVANTRRKKIRQMAAVMQAKQLNAARTQVTADDRLMAFHLANS